MTYTKGVIETAIQAVYDRLLSHKTTNGKLKDIQSIVVGARARETGDAALPRIVINVVDFTEESKNTAYSASQKNGTLKLEFRIQCEKVKESTIAAFSTNVLFDGAGGGAMAIYQWFIDSMVYTAAGVYSPTLTLNLDVMPNASFTTDETHNSIEIVVNMSLKLRYTSGVMGGVLTP
jgi:hypothetical protein